MAPGFERPLRPPGPALGEVSTWAGLTRAADGSPFAFGDRIDGLAADGEGGYYASCGHAVLHLSSAGRVRCVAGSVTQSGDADGAGTAARFNLR